MKPITTGTENFKEFIDKGFYYVDKSTFIESTQLDKVTLFTRPRRFGKTLNMSMLYYFYSNKEKDNAYLFDGLKIKDNKDILKHQNQYPVIFMTLKDMKNMTFASQVERFQSLISKVMIKYYELLESDTLLDIEKNLLNKYLNKTCSLDELQEALYNISICLEKHYGKKVILLIDEYDVPLQAAYQYGYYDEMTNFMSSIFSSALKTNESLERGILTGCLRIAKESIFTGLNNFSVFSIFNKGDTATQFGFTQEEIDELLSYYQIKEYREKIKEWYDGYLFGDIEIYNPWSTLKYVRQILLESDEEPQSYWANTSSNSIVYDYIKKGNPKMKEDFEKLVQGKSITKTINPELTYREMADIDNIYSFLLFTGYLKIKEKKEMNRYEMIIPNKEVKIIYEQSFNQYFRDYTKDKKDELVELLRKGKEKESQKLLTQILKNSISFYDNYESFYHGFLVGLLSGNYDVKSNRESGDGRFDIVIYGDDFDEPCILIECKHSKELKDMKKDSLEAKEQIINQQYTDEIYELGYEIINCYGISFYKKRCYVTLCQ